MNFVLTVSVAALIAGLASFRASQSRRPGSRLMAVDMWRAGRPSRRQRGRRRDLCICNHVGSLMPPVCEEQQV